MGSLFIDSLNDSIIAHSESQVEQPQSNGQHPRPQDSMPDSIICETDQQLVLPFTLKDQAHGLVDHCQGPDDQWDIPLVLDIDRECGGVGVGRGVDWQFGEHVHNAHNVQRMNAVEA